MEFNKYRDKGAYHWREYEQPTTYRRHANYCKEWVVETDCLDIGAGDGLITHLIGCEGIDDNKIAVEMAQERDVLVELGDAYNLPSGMWKAVFIGDVIEHFEFPDKVMKQLPSILEDGGKLYIATPPKQGEKLQDPYHYKEYTPEELREYVESFGFKYIEHTIDNIRIYMSFLKL